MRQYAAWIAMTLCIAGHAATGAPAFVTTLDSPPTAGANSVYVGNRQPLLPNPLLKLPIGAIRPEGWLRTQLQLSADGMFGHLPEVSPWCQFEGNAWVSPDGTGEWGWEELPYWLKGFGDLGYVLDDERINTESRRWIEAVLASQREDGYFGSKGCRDAHDLWPNMVMLNVIQSFYEATGDERVIPFMTRYFRWQLDQPIEQFLPDSWQKTRAADNLQSVYWLYNRTGDEWLLDLAERIHERTDDWSSGIASWHGVNITQAFRGPVQFYQQSHELYHLRASERNYNEIMKHFGQVPGGMFGADENARYGYDDPRQAAEACSMVEFMLSFELLAGITGDPVWADRCEDVAFNSLPAAMTPDLKALHYLTAPNMIQLDEGNKAPMLQNGGCMLAYSADARYRCCQHNVSHGWPYFAEHLWMATRDNGLAAMLYAPSTVEAVVGGGQTVQIVSDTKYPFREWIRLTIKTTAPVRFPLYLRVPEWCRGSEVTLTGSENTRWTSYTAPKGWLRIEREWHDGDLLELQLHMSIELKTWTHNHNSVSVSHGPLTYSLQIGERWEKSGDNAKWPNWQVFPTTPWNYALVLDQQNPRETLTVEYREFPEQPFTNEKSPIVIRAKGRKLPNWKQEYNGMIAELQDSPVRTTEPLEDLTLIPMGAARLRVSSFPVAAADGAPANEWKEPRREILASVETAELRGLEDHARPQSSTDRSAPVFAWFPKAGTAEWIERRFLDGPEAVSGVQIYWYADAGGKALTPKSWRVLYLENDAWREVENCKGLGVAPDRFNTTTFDRVTTAAIRVEVQLQEGASGGILEWRLRK